MLALLPNLGEKIIGKEWLTTDMDFIPFHFLPLIFAFFICAGGLLIFLVFSVLIKKIWEQHFTGGSENHDSCTHSQIKKNDLIKKFYLTLILFLMMVGSLYFILTIIVMIPDYTVRVIAIIISLVFIIAFTVYNYVSFFGEAIQKIKLSRRDGYDFLNIIGNGAFYLIILFCLCYFIAIPVSDILTNPTDPHDVEILTDQEIYSPKISTTIGMELYPTNCTNLKSFYPIYNKTGFRWETNYGFFVTQDPYTSRTILLDNYTVRGSPNKVYWSYSETDIPKDRSPVQIKLKIYLADGTNWIPYTNTSFNLTWTDQNFARVENFTNSHSLGYWIVSHPFMISD